MARPFIMVAPNGAWRQKADHPALPVTTAEIVDVAQACRQAGADGLHLHIRDQAGRHSLDPGQYRETLTELERAAPGLRLQVTTEAADLFDVPTQIGCLETLRPAWASVAVREVARAPDLAARVYGGCANVGTEVQHILYDRADITQLRRWQADGTIRPGQDSVLFVMGRYAAGQISTPEDLTEFIDADAPPVDWMVCAFGPQEHACLVDAAARGADVRVGFENSVTAADGAGWRDNAASVAALVATLDTAGGSATDG